MPLERCDQLSGNMKRGVDGIETWEYPAERRRESMFVRNLGQKEACFLKHVLLPCSIFNRLQLVWLNSRQQFVDRGMDSGREKKRKYVCEKPWPKGGLLSETCAFTL